MKATLHFDGCSKPTNPGPSAGAAVIRLKPMPSRESPSDRAHVVLGNVFEGTNNQAEYDGLIVGLREAIRIGVTDIEIYGDSLLVVNQVQRIWACKKPHLQALLNDARDLLHEFKSWSISWIPRELNGEADAASNEAIDNPRRLVA